MKYIILLTCIYCSFHLFGQTERDTTEIEKLISEGVELHNNSKYKESTVKYLQAKRLAEISQYFDLIIKCETKIILNTWRQGTLEGLKPKARETLNRAKDWLGPDAYEVSEVYHQIGIINMYEGNLDSAIYYYEISAKIASMHGEKGWPTIAASHVNMSIIYSNRGSIHEGLREMRKAYEYDLKLYGENHMFIADDLNNISSFLMYLSRYNEAIPMLKKAHAILQKIENTGESYSYILSNIGHAYSRLKEFKKAHEYEIEALNNNIRIYGELNVSHAHFYEKTGKSFHDEGNYDSSLYYYQKGMVYENELRRRKDHLLVFLYRGVILNYAKKGDYRIVDNYIKKSLQYIRKIAPETQLEGISFNDAGLAYFWKGEYDKAIGYYLRAAKIFETIEDHEGLAPYLLNNLAEVYLKISELEKALENTQLSLRKNHTDWIPSNDLDNPSINGIVNVENAIIALKLKGEILLKLYEETNEPSFLNASISTFDFLKSLLQKESIRIDRIDDKISFASFANEIYNSAIIANKKAYDSTGEIAFLEKCFEYSEEDKATILNNLLNKQLANSWSAIPDSILQIELDLNANLTYLTSALHNLLKSENPDSIELEKKRSEVFRLNQNLDTLSGYLRSKYPNYYKLRAIKPSVSVIEIQNQIPSNESIIEYFIGDSLSYVFLLNKEEFVVKELGPSRIIIDETQKLLHLIKSSSSDHNLIKNFLEQNHKVFNTIIGPIYTQIPKNHNLNFVPSGVLHYIPFEILISEYDGNTNIIDQKYLLNDFQIKNIHSVNSKFLFLKKGSKDLDDKIASFSPSFDNSKNLPPLNWNTFETDKIQEIVGGDVFTGELATEKKFKEVSNNYSILHFATHGFVDIDDYRNSHLSFTNSYDSIEDDKLFLHEISSMQTSASLAVLSLCESGNGTPLKGDGIMSLSQSFAYAGVPSVIMSLWKIDDKATADIMKIFYELLEKGNSANESLRLAKIEYLKTASPNKVHPYYWGALSLVGEDFSFQESYNRFYLLLIIPLLFTFFLSKRKKKSPVN